MLRWRTASCSVEGRGREILGGLRSGVGLFGLFVGGLDLPLVSFAREMESFMVCGVIEYVCWFREEDVDCGCEVLDVLR